MTATDDDGSAAETKRLLNGYKISMKNSFVLLLPSPAVRGFELEKFTMASFPIFNWPLRGGGRRNMRRRARSGIVKHLNDYCCNLCVLTTDGCDGEQDLRGGEDFFFREAAAADRESRGGRLIAVSCVASQRKSSPTHAVYSQGSERHTPRRD